MTDQVSGLERLTETIGGDVALLSVVESRSQLVSILKLAARTFWVVRGLGGIAFSGTSSGKAEMLGSKVHRSTTSPVTKLWLRKFRYVKTEALEYGRKSERVT